MLSEYVRKDISGYNTREIAKTITDYLISVDGSKMSKEDWNRFWKLFQDRRNAELIFLICSAYEEKGYNEF